MLLALYPWWFPAGSTVITDCYAPEEFLSLRRMEHSALGEYSGTLLRDSGNPAEYLNISLAGSQLPTEWNRSILSDALLGVDLLTFLTVDRIIPAESLAAILNSVPFPLEWKGPVSVTLDSSLPTEILASLVRDGIVLTEALTSRRADNTASSESQTLILWDAPFLTDRLQGLLSDEGLSSEWRAGILITTDTNLSIQWGVYRQADSKSPIEWRGIVPPTPAKRTFSVGRGARILTAPIRRSYI